MSPKTAGPLRPAASTPDVARLAADLRLVVARLSRRLRQQGDPRLTPSMLSALWTVERLEPVTLGELAEAERIQPPTLSRVVGRLEDARLVSRAPGAVDRRVALLTLTRDGRRVLDRTRSLRTAFLVRRIDALTEDDREVLLRAIPVLERLLEAAAR